MSRTRPARGEKKPNAPHDHRHFRSARERRRRRSARLRPEDRIFRSSANRGGRAQVLSRVEKEDLPDGEGWGFEWVRLSTHCTTHLDAPWHFASTMDGGKRAITIDEVPLDW